MASGDGDTYDSASIITQSESASTESLGGVAPSAPVMMMSAGAVQAAAADPDLVAWYKFDEGSGTAAADSSGNGNDATLKLGSFFSTDTETGSGHSVDTNRTGNTGTGGYVDAGTFDVSGSTGGITVALWAKLNSFATTGTGNDFRFVSKSTGTGINGHYWMLSNQDSGGNQKPRVRIKVAGTGTVFTFVATGAPSHVLDTWMHLAFTYDGTTITVYRDGVAYDTFGHSLAIAQSASVPVFIGASPPAPSSGNVLRGLDGFVDDVRVYQRGLTAQEIADIFNPPGGGEPLEGGSLDSVGAVQSGAITAAYTLSGDPLDSVGAVQSGGISAAYTLAGGSLDSVGAVQSGATTVAPPVFLDGGSLDSVGAIQSGAVSLSFATEGGSLDSVGAVQSVGTSIVKALQGGSLASVGAVQEGAVTATYTLVGGSLDSVGAVKSGATTDASGAPVGVYNLNIRVYNDVGFSDSATFTWEIQEELQLPQWQTVPGRSDRINVLPQPYNMSSYVSSNAGDPVLWRLATSPSGFSIHSDTGVITATSGAGVGDHTLRVGVNNALGESLSDNFQWEILEELLPPQWSTIPNRSDDDDTLPQNYDVSGYVSSNSGPLDTWSLVAPPTGFTINQSGVITAATDAPTVANGITVQVLNDEGGSQSAEFDWTIVQTTSDGVLHDFNATLGLWAHERAGNAWGYDKDDIDRQVGTDIPIYEGCGFSGSAFTPDAGFLGIRIDAKSTNRYTNNNLLTHSTWALYQAGRTADSYLPQHSTQSSLYKGTSLGQASARHVLSAFTKITSSIGGGNTVQLTPDFNSVIGITPSSSLQQDFVVPTAPLTNAGINSNYTSGTILFQYSQAEYGGFGAPTGPIATAGSAVTRNASALTSKNSDYDWGASDLIDGFCLQIKLRVNIPNDGAVVAPGGYATIYSLGDVSSGSVATQDYLVVYAAPNGNVVCDVYRSGGVVATVTGSGDLQRHGDYDLRLRVDPVNGVRMWVDGPGVSIDVVDAGVFAQWVTDVPDTHRLGSFYVPGDGSDAGVGSFTFKTVRLNRTVLSDAEIIGWS